MLTFLYVLPSTSILSTSKAITKAFGTIYASAYAADFLENMDALVPIHSYMYTVETNDLHTT